MTKEEIINKIIEVLYEIQETSGEDRVEINEATIPIGNLSGFDSLRGVEALVTIAEKLNIEIKGEANLFISKDERKAISINNIADRILEGVA